MDNFSLNDIKILKISNKILINTNKLLEQLLKIFTTTVYNTF